MRWVLIGDDGQHDPAIYADFARAHPRTFRQSSFGSSPTPRRCWLGGRAEAPEGQELLHAGEPGEDTHGYQHVGENRIPWIYGPDGKAISEQLTELGLLR